MDSNSAVRADPSRSRISPAALLKFPHHNEPWSRCESYCFTVLLCDIKKSGGGLYQLINTADKSDTDDSHLIFKVTLLKVLT